MRRAIHVSGLAEVDLEGVWAYTFEAWGAAQADKYLDDLNDGIRRLADYPELGVKRDFVRDRYRVLFVGSHAVYYTVGPSVIHIVRVLHARMDSGQHL